LKPRGHYLANEVGRLAGVSGDRIGQWARRGYIRSSQSSGRPRIYSYQDVAEAMVVHELIDNNVPLKSIKNAIQELRAKYGHDWPLSNAALAVPPGFEKSPLVVIEAEEGFDLARGWQRVLTTANLRRIAGDLSRGGWVAKEIPELRHIEVNPDRLSGRPTIRGLRVPVELVGELASEPDGVAILKRDYELSEPQINDASRWWEAVKQFEKAA
jgi:uncharacterized protein (DUF433 family)